MSYFSGDLENFPEPREAFLWRIYFSPPWVTGWEKQNKYFGLTWWDLAFSQHQRKLKKEIIRLKWADRNLVCSLV